MEFVWIILGVIFVLLIGGLIFSVCYTMPIAKNLYKTQWQRNGKDHYKRDCSDYNFDYHVDMFNQGMEFRNSNLEKVKEVSVTSFDGIKLQAEYYDFGFKKAVIMIPGRTETAYYGAYYAPIFLEAGFNVLCIDPRAHGESEGDKITLGMNESKDVVAWTRLLENEFHLDMICLYGLCGGGTASLIALKNPELSPKVNSFISDGMYYSFFRTYKRHIQAINKPVFPVIFEVMSQIKKHNKVNPYKMAPIKLMKNVDVSMLFLSGNKDAYTFPNEAKKMFDIAPTKNKKLVIIANGRHSHLRYDNKIVYDENVKNFLQSL